MELDTPNLEKHIDELQIQVAPYSNGEIKGRPVSMFNAFSGYKIYIIITFGILVFLLIWRPNLIKNEITDSKGEKTHKLSFQKLFILWAILSTVFIVTIVLYKTKTLSQ